LFFPGLTMRPFVDTLATLVRYRELILSLVARELQARYRGSLLGMAWTFLNPLLLLAVYALVFSVYMRVNLENYAVYMFAGLLPWIWFAASMMDGVNAVVASGNLVTKSMFPAETLPMVKILANFFNYLFSLPLLALFMIAYGTPFTAALLWLPLVALAQLLFTTGLVYLLSAVNVRYRDVQHILGNFITLWFFLCPIIYPVASVPEEWRFTFYLNPMAVITMGYHDVFINGQRPDLAALCAVVALGVALMYLGFRQFELGRETFAEEI